MVRALALLPAHTAADQRSTPTASVASLYFSGTSLRVTMGIVAADTMYPVPAMVVVEQQRAADDITAATVTIGADEQRRPTKQPG